MKAYSVAAVSSHNIASLYTLMVSYHPEWRGELARLSTDLESAKVSMASVSYGNVPIGLVAWTPTYDLNWCFPGGEITDLFVTPAHRGFGAALLLTSVAAEGVRTSGGSFVSGKTNNTAILGSARRFASVEPDGSVYISGRAFKTLAELSGRPIREIIQKLPPRDWNYQ